MNRRLRFLFCRHAAEVYATTYVCGCTFERCRCGVRRDDICNDHARAAEVKSERDQLLVALNVVTEKLDRVITERDQLKTTVDRVGRLRDRWKRRASGGRRDLGADMAYLALTVELGEWPKP